MIADGHEIMLMLTRHGNRRTMRWFAAVAAIALASLHLAAPRRKPARRCARSMSASRSRRRTWCTPRPMWRRRSGFFAKHCVDANIIQFDGGAAGTSVTAVAQGTAISQPARRRDRARPQGQADLGPRAAPAAGLRRARRGEDRRGPQGQAPLGRGRRRRLQLADGARDPAHREPDAGRRAVHLAGHRRTAARIPRRPDRGRRAASGRRVPGAAEEARRAHPDHALRPAAELRVQSLRRIGRADREGPRPDPRHASPR